MSSSRRPKTARPAAPCSGRSDWRTEAGLTETQGGADDGPTQEHSGARIPRAALPLGPGAPRGQPLQLARRPRPTRLKPGVTTRVITAETHANPQNRPPSRDGLTHTRPGSVAGYPAHSRRIREESVATDGSSKRK